MPLIQSYVDNGSVYTTPTQVLLNPSDGADMDLFGLVPLHVPTDSKTKAKPGEDAVLRKGRSGEQGFFTEAANLRVAPSFGMNFSDFFNRNISRMAFLKRRSL